MAVREVASFGSLVRQYRRALALTQEELAERAGLSERAIREIERGGKHVPRKDTVQLLADALELTGDDRDAFQTASRRMGGSDVADPVRVSQIASEADVLPDLPPPEQTPVRHPTNLLDEPTPFIGRKDEAAALSQLLERSDVRLVTLTGPGGSGKTRLALQVAAARLAAFEDGVFLVSLAPLIDPDLVASTIALTLGITHRGTQSLLDTLIASLQVRHLLLVLDNFEHLLGAAPLVADLVRSCPRLQLLVTSREVLHLSVEREFPVPPLALPDLSQVGDLAALLRSDAVALFVDRAQATRPDFALTEDNAASVAALCHRLDGLPLALELAAARIRLFPPPALLARLSHGLDLLTGGARDLPARHQTLRAAIDWSYSLLTEEEQTLFARLSVFAGGCTLEAAEAVCNAAGDLAMGVLDGLASLVEKSLVRQEGESESRFSMLETIREYAQEKLEERGEVGELRRRHAGYFLALAVAESAATEPGDLTIPNLVEDERDNLSAALGWAWEQREPEIGLRLAVASETFWFSDYQSGLGWLERLLALEGAKDAVSPQLRAQALQMASYFAWCQGDAERSRVLAEEGVALGRELGDKGELARSLHTLGYLLREQGDYPGATAILTQALSLAREGGYKDSIAMALINLGNVARETGDAQQVIQLYEESLRLFREIGNRQFIGWSLHNLGWAAWMRGDLDRARHLYDESLSLFRESGAASNNAEFLNSLALVVREQGDVQTAESLLAESLRLCRMASVPASVPVQESAVGLERMAGVAAIQGRAERAARLFGAAYALRSRFGNPIWPVLRPRYDRDLAAVREALGEERFAEEWEKGQAMTVEEAIDYALSEDGKPSRDVAAPCDVASSP